MKLRPPVIQPPDGPRPFDAEQDRRDELAELSWLALAFKLAPAMSTADDSPWGAVVPFVPRKHWKRTRAAVAGSARPAQREWDASNRQEAAASGLCSKCCKRPARPGLRTCAECVANNAARLKAIAKDGMCRKHVNVPVEPGRGSCAVCLAKAAERMRVKRAAERRAA